MGAILIAVTGIDPKAWQERFRTLAPQRDVRGRSASAIPRT